MNQKHHLASVWLNRTTDVRFNNTSFNIMRTAIRYVLFAATSYDTFYNTAAIASAYAATVTGWFDGTTGTWDVNANAIALSGGDVTTLMTVSSSQGGKGGGKKVEVVVVRICAGVFELAHVVIIVAVASSIVVSTDGSRSDGKKNS